MSLWLECRADGLGPVVVFPSRKVAKQLEEASWGKTADLLKMHRHNAEGRLMVLGVMKRLVGGALNHWLSPQTCRQVLEVGCGDGFFSRKLAPQWLRKRMSYLEINEDCLRASQASPDRLTVGSMYSLPLKSESLDALISLSSLDSLIYPEDGIQEIARALREGGRLIVFQDLKPEIYLHARSERHEPLERFHQRLVLEIRKNGHFQILTGEREHLEAVGSERWETVKNRLGEAFSNCQSPFCLFYDRGESKPGDVEDFVRMAKLIEDYSHGFKGGVKAALRELMAVREIELPVDKNWRPGRVAEYASLQFRK